MFLNSVMSPLDGSLRMAWPQSRIAGRRVQGKYFELGLQESVPPRFPTLALPSLNGDESSDRVPFCDRVKKDGRDWSSVLGGGVVRASALSGQRAANKTQKPILYAIVLRRILKKRYH